MQYKAVIFDLDGTLINTLADLCDSTNYALLACGFSTVKLEKFNMYVGDGIPKMIERALGEHGTLENVERVKLVFLEYYAIHHSDKTTKYEGVADLIIELKNRGLRIAVVTNKVENMAKLILSNLYGDVFDLIFGQRDSVPSKPDPTLTLMAMENLGVKPVECIFLGDSGVDVKTAVNSGAVPVGALWGFRDKEELIESGAEYVISKPSDLLNILQ